jgi:hypothetical protein
MSIKVRFSILFSWYVDDLCHSIIGHRSIDNKYRYRYHLWQHGNAWTNDIFPTGWLLPDSSSWVVCLDNPERRKTRQQLSTKKNMGHLGLVMNRGFIYIYRQNRCNGATQQEQCDGTTKRVRVARGKKKKKHGPSKKYGAYIRYVTRDILPSPVKKVGNILACHINGLCTICLGDGWFVQDTRKTLGEVRLVCLVCCMLLLHM